MSYCRWSCLNGYSDVYVYESAEGWITHVAKLRQPAGAPADDMGLLLAGEGNDHPARVLFAEQHKAYQTWRESVTLVPINLPEAGETFAHETPGKCADNLERLRNAGFIVPVYALTALREEQAELESHASAPRSRAASR